MPNDPIIDDDDIDRLELDAARAFLRRALRRNADLAADFELVGRALMAEAVRRDWCDEYESFVEKVNADTTLLDLPSRNRDFRVEHTYTVRIIGQVAAIDTDTGEHRARAQYRDLREGLIFDLTNQPEVDHGSLIDVEWEYQGSTAVPEED